MQADYQKASSSFDPATSHKYLLDMMNIAVNDAYFLFWMHDLNLRVMSPKVHGFIEPKSWWVDFDNITVDG
jgi:peptide/nickel transport system substrate-binding protein